MPPADYSKEITGTRTEQRVKMSRMRQRIAQRLKDAQNTNAMLTTFNELDMRSVTMLVIYDSLSNTIVQSCESIVYKWRKYGMYLL